MSLPDRREIARLIGLPCMIRRERGGQALFISDHRKRLGAEEADAADTRLKEAGYLLKPRGELTLIDWAPGRYLRFFAGLNPSAEEGAACLGVAGLLARHPAALKGQDLALLSRALRLLLAGERDKLTRLTEQGLADALRERRAPPFHALPLLTRPFGHEEGHEREG